MPRIAISIGRQRFATKTEARSFVSTMLDRYQDGQRIGDDDEVILRDLLDLHPKAAAKIGCGVSRFTREPDGRGGRCFWLWRNDGSHSDWSTGKALKLTGPRNDLLNALRCEVEAQRNEFLRSQSAGGARVVCAITADPLTPETAHVDHHDPTFGQIARDFLEREGLGTRLPLPELTDAGTRRYLTDRALAERWRTHHRQCAVLRLTTAEANLRRKRGPRTTVG